MRRVSWWLALVVLLLLLPLLPVAGAGCSDEPKTCRDDPPSVAADAPAVSFSKDVFPIFAGSCAFTSCHGSTSGTANGVFLGGLDPAKIHKAIVDVDSPTLPGMSLVKPGDPKASFVMKKLDGTQCAFDARCKGGRCGDSMPRGEEPLPSATRDVVRRWIAQGAKND